MKENNEFKIGEIVQVNEVPSWARRQPKWTKLQEAVRQLQPGQCLTVYFCNEQGARRASNTVRDDLTMEMGHAVISTRTVSEGDQFKVFFTRLHDSQVVEEEHNPQ